MNISSTGIRLSRINTRVRVALSPDLKKLAKMMGMALYFFMLFSDQVIEHRLQIIVG
jgi:hypothetical protein